MYYKGKEMRTMSLNTHYLIVFKNPRDKQQITVLSRQMNPSKPRYLLDEFEKATSKPFGYLFIDLKQNTPDDQRLSSDIYKAQPMNYSAFDNLINRMYEKFDEKYSNLVDMYINEGIREEEAEQKAIRYLKPSYEETFMDIYKQFLINVHELNKNKLHATLKNTIEFHLAEGYNVRKAVSLALDMHKEELRDLLKDL